MECSNKFCKKILEPTYHSHTHTTSHGYRNKYTSFTTHFFCSEECLDYFKNHSCCKECNEEDIEGNNIVYIKELSYSLCTTRGDMEIPCQVKYELEKIYIKDKLKIFDLMNKNLIELSSFDKLKKLIEERNFKITFKTLSAMCQAINSHNILPILVPDFDRCFKCHNDLQFDFFFVQNDEGEGLVCKLCSIKDSYRHCIMLNFHDKC